MKKITYLTLPNLIFGVKICHVRIIGHLEREEKNQLEEEGTHPRASTPARSLPVVAQQQWL